MPGAAAALALCSQREEAQWLAHRWAYVRAAEGCGRTSEDTAGKSEDSLTTSELRKSLRERPATYLNTRSTAGRSVLRPPHAVRLCFGRVGALACTSGLRVHCFREVYEESSGVVPLEETVWPLGRLLFNPGAPLATLHPAHGVARCVRLFETARPRCNQLPW